MSSSKVVLSSATGGGFWVTDVDKTFHAFGVLRDVHCCGITQFGNFSHRLSPSLYPDIEKMLAAVILTGTLVVASVVEDTWQSDIDGGDDDDDENGEYTGECQEAALAFLKHFGFTRVKSFTNPNTKNVVGVYHKVWGENG